MEYIIRNNDSLQHYGVIGMKWGVHKARSYNRKANRAKRLGKYDDAKMYRENSNRQRKIVTAKKQVNSFNKSRGLGKRIATNLIGGLYANRTYGTLRTAGYSRSVSLGATWVTGMFPIVGHFAVSHVVLRDAVDKGVYDKK